MARTLVVELDVEGGRKLIEALDEAGFVVQSALWFLAPDADEWRLIISTPVVDKSGPLKAYEGIQNALHSLPGVAIRLDYIAAVGIKHPVVTSLRTAIKTGPALDGLRLARSLIHGTYFEDSYIYRVQ